LAVKALCRASLAEGLDHSVYIDPYTNQVRGELTTSWTNPPLQQWPRTLPSSLHVGPVGRIYAELVASWLPIIILAGLLLWIARQRGTGHLGGLRAALTPALGKGTGRGRTRGTHATLGVWLTIGLLAVSITGLTWCNTPEHALTPCRTPATPPLRPWLHPPCTCHGWAVLDSRCSAAPAPRNITPSIIHPASPKVSAVTAMANGPSVRPAA
jgi:hypothetical protein